MMKCMHLLSYVEGQCMRWDQGKGMRILVYCIALHCRLSSFVEGQCMG